ncbi:hypothetical protein SAMN04487965_3697 [Microbulbifer donghaiensis]|uniref:N-acetyltransferase domain-containing protein n=1 Tax=Microbulbifer donghaiensis TaxID=494016 RepID=A0A1M5IKJ1_9GAMM|nr:hypothetical protein [Microbulbifer donghaiensis]SHG28832.1 hypothetical protein SAMN04487965_3697 [Microbulbifer donghaiensis]
MLATHMDAERRYSAYRSEVFKHVKETLTYSDSHLITLADINQRALAQARLWATIPGREVDFNWERDCQLYRKRYPKRFELAIWYQNRLESLALGRPSYNGSRVRLELVERIAGHSYLKGRVFLITELSLIAYASLLGAEEIRIMEPINESVKNYYVSRGYTYVPSKGAKYFPDYCVKKL